MIMCLVGAVFLMDEFVPGINISDYFWPVFIIAAGLYMIFGRENKWEREWKRRKAFGRQIVEEVTNRMETSPEDYIDHVAIFGSIEKNIISKDFRGGDIVCIFSGSEINLSRAEIKQPIVMDITNIFGGTSLILPPNWEIKSEMVAILGGIEDKRIQQATIPDNPNVLILKGTTILGGIEIKSF
jgi:predicted membrane protein